MGAIQLGSLHEIDDGPGNKLAIQINMSKQIGRI